MSSFVELDAYLHHSFSPDNWSDSGIEHATTILRDFVQDDWELLKSVWCDRHSQWQQYCAQILPWGDLRYSLPILLAMLATEDDNLTVMAADVLRDLDKNVVSQGMTPTLKDHLERIAQKRSGITSTILYNFLRQVAV